MLVVTQTYPNDIIEDVKDKFRCVNIIQDAWRLTYEEAEIFYTIISVNNLLIIPSNRHQIAHDKHFYVGVGRDDIETVKNDIRTHTDTFYVVVHVEMLDFSTHLPLLKLARIEDTSIMYIDPAYLRPTLITNILNDLEC